MKHPISILGSNTAPSAVSASRSQSSSWCLSLALALTSTVGCVQMEGDIPEVVVTHQHIVFEGLPKFDLSDIPEDQLPPELQGGFDGSEIPEGYLPEALEGQIDEDLLPEGIPDLDVTLNPDGSLSTSFDHPYDAFEVPNGVETYLEPVRATLIPTSGVQDLSFLRVFTLTIGSHAPNGPESLIVFEYRRDGAGGDSSRLTIDSSTQPNLLDYWESEGTYYTLTVAGELPDHQWAIDVELEFHARIKLEL